MCVTRWFELDTTHTHTRTASVVLVVMSMAALSCFGKTVALSVWGHLKGVVRFLHGSTFPMCVLDLVEDAWGLRDLADLHELFLPSCFPQLWIWRWGPRDGSWGSEVSLTLELFNITWPWWRLLSSGVKIPMIVMDDAYCFSSGEQVHVSESAVMWAYMHWCHWCHQFSSVDVFMYARIVKSQFAVCFVLPQSLWFHVICPL